MAGWLALVNHLITYGGRKVGLWVPTFTDGYLWILDPVRLFGVMCTPAEKASHLCMRCIAKLCVQHRTANTDQGFTNGVYKFPWG